MRQLLTIIVVIIHHNIKLLYTETNVFYSRKQNVFTHTHTKSVPSVERLDLFILLRNLTRLFSRILTKAVVKVVILFIVFFTIRVRLTRGQLIPFPSAGIHLTVYPLSRHPAGISPSNPNGPDSSVGEVKDS